MLFSINGVARLTRSPELKYLPSGSAVMNIGLACSQRRKDQSGQIREESCFIDGKLFGRRAETLSSWLHKGSQIYITGDLKFEQWQDQSGQNRSKHTIFLNNIELLDKKNDNHQNQTYDYTPPSNPAPNNQSPEHTQNRGSVSMDRKIPEIDIDNDEIPF